MWFDNTEVEASLLRDYGMCNIQGLLFVFPCVDILKPYMLKSIINVGDQINAYGNLPHLSCN